MKSVPIVRRVYAAVSLIVIGSVAAYALAGPPLALWMKILYVPVVLLALWDVVLLWMGKPDIISILKKRLLKTTRR